MKLVRLTSTMKDTPIAVNPAQIIQVMPTERSGTWITTAGVNANGTNFVITVQEDFDFVVGAVFEAMKG